jgi:hypothetical protein
VNIHKIAIVTKVGFRLPRTQNCVLRGLRSRVESLHTGV